MNLLILKNTYGLFWCFWKKNLDYNRGTVSLIIRKVFDFESLKYLFVEEYT